MRLSVAARAFAVSVVCGIVAAAGSPVDETTGEFVWRSLPFLFLAVVGWTILDRLLFPEDYV